MNPLVSVAMGVYNVERFIKAAVESVLNQSYERIELVVADDGSTDGTIPRLEEVKDDRLTIIRCPHRGSAATRNYAIRRTTGKYVGLIDGDDAYLPGKIERHVAVLENSPGTDVSFALFQGIDEDDVETGPPSRPPRLPLSFETLLADNPINGSSAIVRRTAFANSGLFDETLPSCLDVDLWLRLALVRENNLQCVPEVLSLYRRRSGQITGDWRRMERGWGMMMNKLQTIAPSRMARMHAEAGCHWYRYLAYLADHQGDSQAALRCLRKSIRFKPARALRDPHTWMLGSALVSTFFIPETVHRSIRRNVRRVLNHFAV